MIKVTSEKVNYNETEKRWEKTHEVIDEFEIEEGSNYADHRELYSTENNLETAIYQSEENNYFYIFTETEIGKTYTYWTITPNEFEKTEFSKNNKETQTVTLDGITLADYYNDNDHEDGTFAKIENGRVVIRNEYEDNAIVEVWGFEEN